MSYKENDRKGLLMSKTINEQLKDLEIKENRLKNQRSC